MRIMSKSTKVVAIMLSYSTVSLNSKVVQHRTGFLPVQLEDFVWLFCIYRSAPVRSGSLF